MLKIMKMWRVDGVTINEGDNDQFKRPALWATRTSYFGEVSAELNPKTSGSLFDLSL